jgi:uncharacterized Rmd1/YagE family protein
MNTADEMTTKTRRLSSEAFEAHAFLLGERLDVRGIKHPVARHPAIVEVGDGWAALFRYGAVVFFGVPEPERVQFVEGVSTRLTGAYAAPHHEMVEIRIAPSNPDDDIDASTLVLEDASVERLQVVADVLAKSVVLDQYEAELADVFKSVEPLAVDLARGGGARRARYLLSHIGGTLRIQHKMVGRVEVSEKPDLLWERPDLERLYLQLEDEFELSERHTALERKLDLIHATATTALEMVRDRRSLRVEWYITVLIVVEIALTLYELAVR